MSINMVLEVTTQNKVSEEVAFKDREPLKKIARGLEMQGLYQNRFFLGHSIVTIRGDGRT